MTKHFLAVHPDRLISLKSILYLLLALALVRGVIYTAAVPPWQASEPAQFERVRVPLTAVE